MWSFQGYGIRCTTGSKVFGVPDMTALPVKETSFTTSPSFVLHGQTLTAIEGICINNFYRRCQEYCSSIKQYTSLMMHCKVSRKQTSVHLINGVT